MSSVETLTHATEEAAPAATAQEQAHQHAPDHQHATGPALNPECTRDVEVEIPADEVSAAFRKVIRNYTRQARIPGFRAGKVPPALIKSRFDEQIRQDVVEQLLPQHFRTAIENKGVQPISQPQVTELHLADGEPLRFKALFEVMPELNLDGWQEIRVERENAELTDAEFEAELERVRDSRSTLEPVAEDRPLEEGDVAQISFHGEIVGEGSASEPIQGQDVTLDIGGKNTLPAFSDGLRGTKVGQELKLEVSYPAEYAEPKLAGKSVAYDVTVKAIKRRNAPELNDDFAKELGEYETMDEFREKLREHSKTDKMRHAEAATKDKALEALAGRYNFPIPETLVQQQIDARLERGLRTLAQQGMPEEQMRKLDFPRLRVAQREDAVGEVQGSMLLDRIAQLENIEVADAELDRELEMLSVQMREPLESLRERLTKDGSVERIREQIRREKAGTLLYQKLGS